MIKDTGGKIIWVLLTTIIFFFGWWGPLNWKVKRAADRSASCPVPTEAKLFKYIFCQEVTQSFSEKAGSSSGLYGMNLLLDTILTLCLQSWYNLLSTKNTAVISLTGNILLSIKSCQLEQRWGQNIVGLVSTKEILSRLTLILFSTNWLVDRSVKLSFS